MKQQGLEMRRMCNRHTLVRLLGTAIAFLSIAAADAAAGVRPEKAADALLAAFPNGSGVMRTISLDGKIDLDNPFFQRLGSNGRDCGSCHVASDGWTVTPAHIEARFNATDGLDPIFRPVDGAGSPTADVSTVAARRQAYGMLLTKGLIRVGIGSTSG